MLNVKETLKRLHKRLPTLSLDELFELLDCYIEETAFSRTISTWEPPSKIWYSTDKTTGINETYGKITTELSEDPGIYTINTNLPHGKIKYYDGGGSTQLVADH